MTTSAQTVYELSRDSIIAAAMRKVAALAKGQTPDSEDLTNGQQALNALIAEFQTLGMPLWGRKDYSITLVASQRDYTIGAGQTINTPFPLKIQTAILEHTSGSIQEVNPIGKSDFQLLNTSSTGMPVNYTYQTFVNYGVLSLWPKPDSTAVSGYTLKITYQRPLEGFTSASETSDFPQEWQNALIYNLAVALAPEYGVPIEDRRELKKEAADHLSVAMSAGGEEASIFFQVDRR